MARSKSGSTAGEMLSNLKSRLGFAHNESEDEEFAHYDADFDDYDDFDGDYRPGYDEGYSGYEDYAADPLPEGTGGFRAATTRSGRFGRPDSTPNLVSIEDVREHSKTLMGSSRGSYEQAHRPENRFSARRSSSPRNLVEASGPAPSSPAYTAAQREAGLRSEGLNSLFESTSPRQERLSSSTALGGTRGLTVVKPRDYNDVEGVARALKAGDAVVLVMADTPDELFKRILDFSFGVASALDASVDSPASRVYAITCRGALTEDEKNRLRTQGVL